MVNMFMVKLEKGYGKQLDDKVRKYIYYAVDGSKRMTDLINELLAYARLSGDENIQELTDLNLVIEEIINLQKGVLENKNATISYERLPVLLVEKTPIKILFQNLISNALKYMSPETIPSINISVTEKHDYWEFGIKDNGIGIDNEDHLKIFQLFKRLHTREEFEGTGMEIAAFKKIVGRHDGSIWVYSKIGEGSTLYFTIHKLIG